MAPPDVPEAVSPDCQDVVFAPGEVSSRPGFQRQLSPLGSAITSAKSFVNPDPTSTHGTLQNLYLDAGGNLWVENVIASPGTLTLITAGLAPNSYMKAITAFGREYMAITDGLHGTDVPLQWDGTNLDRVTQDAPGGAPAIANIILPPVAMALTGVPAVLTIATTFPQDQLPNGSFLSFGVIVTSLGSLAVGNQIVIAGNSVAAYNGTWAVLRITPAFNLFVVSAFLPAGTVGGAGGTVTIGSGVSMVRADNFVTVTTAAIHRLQVGFQAQITGVPAFPVGGGTVVSIVVNNEDNPGLATVTTTTAHGLVPGVIISLDKVAPVIVGGATNFSRQGGIVTATTTTPHGLAIGSSITVAGTTSATLTGSFIVTIIQSPTVFIYPQVDTDLVENGGPGQILVNWPLPTTANPPNFEVVAATSTTSFQIALAYSNITFVSGVVTFPWDGTFFVSAVLNPTTFQYRQIGPPGTSSAIGTVTPHGQASPGEHQMQVLFLTRNGAITAPSPPVKFVANGGQYLSVTNIPIGPPNVIVARIIAFTGVLGAFFFYIPVPAQVGGQIVSTPTQIDDNTSTSALLDFSDNTLFASLGVNIPGNTLANQIVLDGALGFGYYASRLFTWGQRNRVQNLQNLGFDGGFYPSDPTLPTGWFTQIGTGSGGALATGHFGFGWQFGGAGNIHQFASFDAYGAPILQPNTLYRFRAWLKGAGGSATITMSSNTTGFSTTATITGASAVGSFVEATFAAKTPVAIPADLIIALTGTGALIDEISIIFADNPYTDLIFNVSYADNPEGFDGVSGVMGSTDDTQKIMGQAEIRDTGFCLTQDPGGRLHEFSDNGVTEPAGWTFRQIATNCGLISVFALCFSQSDSATASGGEQWFAWMASNGAQIFGGGEVFKISQEIQPDWVGAKDAGASQWSKATGLDPAHLTTAWALNDPKARVIYFGLPVLGLPV